MWPVVPHQGMIQHEETPGSNKKQAVRGACFIAIQPDTDTHLAWQHWVCRGDAAQIMDLIYEAIYFYFYQMHMI